MISKPKLLISFFYLILYSAAALVLELMKVIHIPALDYDSLYFLSYFILLFGWLYSILFLLIKKLFLQQNLEQDRLLNILFLITQAGIISIVICGLIFNLRIETLIALCCFSILVYIFEGNFILRTTRLNLLSRKSSVEYKYIYAAIFFLAVSTIGIWRMMNLKINEDLNYVQYSNALEFILLYQVNGWLLFAFVGCAIKLLKDNNILYSTRRLNTAFWFLFISALPSFFFSFLKFDKGIYILPGSLFFAAGQITGMFFLFSEIHEKKNSLFSLKPKPAHALFMIFVVSFLFKFFIPVLISVSAFFTDADIKGRLGESYFSIPSIGFISIGIFLLLNKMGAFDLSSKLNKTGAYIFLFGFSADVIADLANVLRYWLSFPVIPYFNGLSLFTSFAVLIGVVLLWTGQINGVKNRM